MQYKKKKHLISFPLLLLSVLFFLSACYNARYQLEACSETIRKISYTQKFTGNGFTAFFDASIKKSKTIDEWIDRFTDFSSVLQEKDFHHSRIYYISDNLVVHADTTDSEEIKLFFPAKITKEEAFAWLLSAEIGNSDLPYGVYAGVAAYWLNDKGNSFSVLDQSTIAHSGYLTEMQFPLYETDNLGKKERSTAWNISYSLVCDWLNTGATENELMSLTRTKLESYLQSQYQISLPNYEFYPDSTDYEYKIIQGCFTYYINKEYRDLILPEKHFATSYDYLADWLKDNWQMKKESDAVFHISSMYDINVYLDDVKISKGLAGEAYQNISGNYIMLYSVGSFSHEYIHHILYYIGKSGYLREVFPEMKANDSKYSNLMWYYLFSGKSSYPYAKEIKEKKTYQSAMKLYNKKSAEPAAVGQFDFWLFADCFASLYTNKGEAFLNRLQPVSLQKWIANTYGADIVWQLNLDNHLIIDGKTYNEVCDDWLDYIKKGDFK